MKQALEMALEALELVNIEFVCNGAHHAKKDRHELGDECPITVRYQKAITAIKEALAQPEQEPVAKKMTAHRAVYFMERFKHDEKLLGPNEQAALDFVISMLEAQPPQRKPLTDEQIDSVMKSCINDWGLRQFARAIEAAHGIKE